MDYTINNHQLMKFILHRHKMKGVQTIDKKILLCDYVIDFTMLKMSYLQHVLIAVIHCLCLSQPLPILQTDRSG